MYLDPAEDQATARRTLMVAAPGKDTESVEEHLPSGHAWKNPMPAAWPSKVGGFIEGEEGERWRAERRHPNGEAWPVLGDLAGHTK